MHESDTLSREEIRTILMAIHRENQALWSKWLGRASEASERVALYRYREGFDAAILNLAQHFRIQLRGSEHLSSEGEKPDKAKVISLEKIVISANGQGVMCPRCKERLFRMGEKTWHCAVCEMKFFSMEEE